MKNKFSTIGLPLLTAGALLFIGGASNHLYEKYSREGSKTELNEPASTSDSRTYSGILGTAAYSYSEGKDSVGLLGVRGKANSNVLEVKVGGKKFTFYDYSNKRPMAWDSGAEMTPAGIERVTIELEEGKETTYDISNVNDANLKGERTGKMLKIATRVYKAFTEKIRKNRQDEESANLGPGPDAFSPFKEIIKLDEEEFH